MGWSWAARKSHLETVSAFFRCPVPFALRRIPHDAKYRILGRAYVDGLMDGEVFDLRDFEKHGYETRHHLHGIFQRSFDSFAAM
jgi:hypothetical protein